ncbi:MAG: PilT/PilU family type 4a pilus ATPase [Bdellovibrionales bacterium]|nr:PilT/PilU family type 4a pilus ATPase [Bdellovibrionales bacterium]
MMPDDEAKPQEGQEASVAVAEAPSSVTIPSLLRGLVKHKGSDLHLKAGRPPLYRINGRLVPTKLPPLSQQEVTDLVYSTMTDRQKAEFEEKLEIDYGFAMPGVARFRSNVFMQKGSVALAVRRVPMDIPAIDTLGLPPVLKDLALKQRGLVLITGSTGSGKSTTLSSFVDYINRNRRAHIITIEDPIEYVHEDKMSTVSQREVGSDTHSMQNALIAALRQDPDVIIVGEMRDYQTMQVAITAAETGHLVVSTMHTNSASKSIDRILDSFPAESKNQVRMQLASSIQGVITQQLIRRADGKGMVPAVEVLVRSPTVEKLILDNKVSELQGSMESSNLYYKMQSMNQALEQLVRSGAVTQEEAVHHSDRKEDLLLKLSGMVGGGSGSDAAALMNIEDTAASVIGVEEDRAPSPALQLESTEEIQYLKPKAGVSQKPPSRPVYPGQVPKKTG